MNLQQALEFVRNSDGPEWNALIREMNLTTKRRDIEVATKLNVGDWGAYDANDTGAVTKANDNLLVSVLLDRLQVASEAPTPPTPPTIPGYGIVFDHFVRPQTNSPTYARSRKYKSTSNDTKIFWQYQRRCPWLRPWKITLIADDRHGLTAADVWQVVRYCRSYQLLLVELALDFSIPSRVNRAFVRRYGIFGKSRRRA